MIKIVSKQVEKIKRKKIEKYLTSTLKYKRMELKRIRRTGKQKDGKYIYEGLIIPQGMGIATILKAKNLDDYFKQVKRQYDKK